MIYKKLNLQRPEEPDNDPITKYVINVYRRASRGRRYVLGRKAVPMPLTARDITDWVEAHPGPLDRMELDAAVFALDEIDINPDQE